MKAFGLVSSEPEFYEQPAVMDGFSDLMVQVLGDRGLHARSAMEMCIRDRMCGHWLRLGRAASSGHGGVQRLCAAGRGSRPR